MKRKQAFTLIELLVVIAIIALMLGILLPSLQKAKEQAKSVFCLNNLRQMAMAASNYNSSYDEYYPIAQYAMESSQAVTASVTSYSFGWDFTVKKNGTGQETLPGTLWQGDTIDKVHQCPSYKGADNWAGVPYTGYNYNTSYIGHGQGEWTSSEYQGAVVPHPIWPDWYKIVMPAKSTEIKNTARCALFGDGHSTGGANKFMRAPQVWAGDQLSGLKMAGTQGYRHLGKTNVAFCDGHVESWKELYTDIDDNGKKQIERYNESSKIKIGFLSPDNSLYDLK